MIRVNVAEGKAKLSEYLDALRDGKVDVVVLCRRNEPIAELRAIAKERTRARPVGLAKGFAVPPSFFEPLPDDLVAALSGEG